MMKLRFELHDHNEKVHRKFQGRFGKKATLEDLKEKISAVWRIKPEFQSISVKNATTIEGEEKYEESDRDSIVFKAGSKVVVKHKDLQSYIEYEEKVIAVRRNLNKAENSKKAVDIYKKLVESEVFQVYDSFQDFQEKFHHKVAAYSDGDKQLIETATRTFFSKLYSNEMENGEFSVSFENPDPKLGGKETNRIANVQLHGEKSKYNIKLHHYGPKGTSPGSFPDVTEIFVYQLLYTIGLGPKVYIIPPNSGTGSKTCFYIASEWNTNIVLLKSIITKKENKLSIEISTQLVLLRTLLFLADMHLRNCGKWGESENASILDFGPTNKTEVYEDIGNKLNQSFVHSEYKKQYFEVRSRYNDEYFFELAKFYLEKWNISSRIDQVRDEVFSTIDILKSMDVGFRERQDRRNPKDQLNIYIDDLNQNLENLQMFLRKVV